MLPLWHALACTAEPRFVSCTVPEVGKGTEFSPRYEGTRQLGQFRCIVCRSITDAFPRYFRRSASTQRVLFAEKMYSRGAGALFRLPKASMSRRRHPSAYPPARGGTSRTARAHARAGASPRHATSRRFHAGACARLRGGRTLSAAATTSRLPRGARARSRPACATTLVGGTQGAHSRSTTTHRTRRRRTTLISHS